MAEIELEIVMQTFSVRHQNRNCDASDENHLNGNSVGLFIGFYLSCQT